MKFLKLFENFETDKPKSKTQIKKELWRKNNPAPEGKVYKPEELSKFDLPSTIVEMMKTWPIIFKSPYSNSFYSSDDISWTSKPDKSYRVSDHWNFLTSVGKKIHCQTTEPVKNKTHCSIGQYDEKIGKYKILLSEPTNKHIKEIENKRKNLTHLQDPETIHNKKILKDDIKSGVIFAEFEIDGEKYKGQVDKYTGKGGTIRLKNDKGEVIYSKNYFYPKSFKLLDKNGYKILDPL